MRRAIKARARGFALHQRCGSKERPRTAEAKSKIGDKPTAPALCIRSCCCVLSTSPKNQPGMKNARKKPTVAKLRSWRVIIMRSRGEYLGSVEAPESGAGWGAAVKQD